MTAPRRTGAEQGNMRGIAVLVVSVIAGLAFLHAGKGGLVGSTDSGQSKPHGTTTTSTSPTTSSPSSVVTANTGGAGATTGTAHTPATVKVLVVNASQQSGVGASNKTLLVTAGFDVTDVKNGPALAATTVYYEPGYQADAAAVKTAVHQPNAQVVALPSTPIVPEASSNNVTVAFGKDYKAG